MPILIILSSCFHISTHHGKQRSVYTIMHFKLCILATVCSIDNAKRAVERIITQIEVYSTEMVILMHACRPISGDSISLKLALWEMELLYLDDMILTWLSTPEV